MLKLIRTNVFSKISSKNKYFLYLLNKYNFCDKKNDKNPIEFDKNGEVKINCNKIFKFR
jgi:hypothetical protein